MPRGDGTGPIGMGPMIGRGSANCVGYVSSGFANRGVGFGRGFRRMFCIIGMPGWARVGYLQVMPSGQVIDEKTALKNQEDFL